MLMALKGTVNVEDRQRSDKHDGITALSNDERTGLDNRDKQPVGPFDIDRILPVDASGVIVDI